MNLPNCKTPMSKDTQPEMKVRRTAKSAPKCDFSNVSRVIIAAIAVGPTGTSLHEPNIVYTKQAMNDE